MPGNAYHHIVPDLQRRPTALVTVPGVGKLAELRRSFAGSPQSSRSCNE